VEPAAELTAAEVRRYSRHLLIPEIGRTGQRRLKNAKVACVGAGGLGSPALTYLAAAGVGTLGIVDFDVVEESNLQRQVIHGQSDVGRSKAVSARESIREINPLVDVRLHEVRLDAGNALDVLAGYDLVLDGTDNFPTRYLVNDACVLLNKPYVWGSIFRFDGQVSVFWAEHGPHYRDLFPSPPPAGSVPSCAEGGVLGALCASIGAVMATEAVKLVTGVGEPLVGRLMVHDALEMSWRTITVRRDPAGERVAGLVDYEALCGVPGPVGGGAPGAAGGGPGTAADGADGGAISVQELAAMLARRERGEEDFVLVDVREPAEHDIVRIPGSVLVPKEQILRGAALPELPQDRRIVLHCRSGARSAEVLEVLRGAGFRDAVHVDGGVLAWAEQIDPSLPTY
jgi:adenylyltransferase/sulfurtransferase